MDILVDPDVGVEGDEHPSAFEGDRIPGLGITLPPVHPQGCDAGQTASGRGIGLEDALGDQERRRGIEDLVADAGWDVQQELESGRRLVLILPTLAEPRTIGADLVESRPSVDPPDRDQQGRDEALVAAEAEAPEFGAGIDRAISAILDLLSADPRG